MIEYPERDTKPVATYTASDPEGASVRWSLGGVDAEDFTIEDGVLRFAKTPDYETRKGGTDGTSNTYVVDVRATDETRRMGSETVTVNVTDVDEDGTVELSALRPQSATAFTASITDPDGAVTNKEWQWSKSSSRRTAFTAPSTRPLRPPTRRWTATLVTTCGRRLPTRTRRMRARRRRWSPTSRCEGAAGHQHAPQVR